MIDIILGATSLLIVSYLIYVSVRLRVERKKIFALYVQSELDKHAIYLELQKAVEENKTHEIVNSDGFLKFISDSRDWAFEYIEQTQQALIDFDKAVSPIFEWSKTYGIVLENVHSEQIEKISLAYDKLKEVLPRDNETPNN